MRLVMQPVRFRPVAAGTLFKRIDRATTVADEPSAGMRRVPLFCAGFVCSFDPAKRPSVKRDLAADHVIVS